MPSIVDKLAVEQHNERMVRLYSEAAFYKAYERSAYLFVTQVRPYEARRTHLKVVGGDVVSIAFPKTVLASLGVDYQEQADGAVLISMSAGVDEQAFQLWRADVALHQPRLKIKAPVSVGDGAAVSASSAEHEVVERIRCFNLADATPMQCMLLLSELQRKLK